MATPQQIELAKKYGYTQDQINQELATPGTVKRNAALGAPVYEQPINGQYASATPKAPTVPTTTPKVPDVGQTSTGVNAGGETTYNFGAPKPTIATTDKPVIGTPPATTPKAVDFTTATPEQLKAQYMTIGTKLPGEVTDEDRRFAKYLQTRIGLGETMDTIFGTKNSKSSGTTQFSTELVQPGENILSSNRNPDGTYNVVFKDGTSQTTTSEPSTTVFPEGTPEYYAQKAAQENQKRVDVLSEQLNTEAERRKKETSDLVAKYGENIATQFQTQKADIEANGAKRMDALNTGLSFSGFGRSTLALEKRDEIAKNIETTINQAKAKADLELMAYRMEQEGADQVAIAGMRKNIADVQAQIDDANYENQLEIIKLNQENATTGSEAMNNLLETISNSAEIVSNADLDKSQELGYFVDKNGALMLDSQKRPIQFEGTASGLTPDQIKSYSDAISKGVIKAEDLDKTLTPAQKADILKDVAVQNGTYTPPTKPSGQTTMAKIKGKTVTLDTVAMDSFQKAMAAMPENTVIGAQQYRTPEQQAKLKAEGKSWTLDSNHMKGMAVDIYDGDPSKKPNATQIAIMNQNGWFQDPALLAKGDYGHFDYKGVGGGTGDNGSMYTEQEIELLSELANMDASPRNTALKAQGIPLQRVTDYMAQAKAGNIPPTESQKQSSAQIMSQIQDLVSTDWNDATGFQINPFFSIGGTDRATAEGKIASLIAAITLPNLGILKGPMSDKDLAFIQNASTRLNTKQSDKEFEEQLIELYNIGARKNGMKEITKLSDMPKDRIMAGQNKITPTGNTGTTAPEQNMSTTTASDWDF